MFVQTASKHRAGLDLIITHHHDIEDEWLENTIHNSHNVDDFKNTPQSAGNWSEGENCALVITLPELTRIAGVWPPDAGTSDDTELDAL